MKVKVSGSDCEMKEVLLHGSRKVKSTSTLSSYLSSQFVFCISVIMCPPISKSSDCILNSVSKSDSKNHGAPEISSKGSELLVSDYFSETAGVIPQAGA